MTKQEIEEILTKVDITEDSCNLYIDIVDDYYGPEVCTNYYKYIIQAIEKFMDYVEKNNKEQEEIDRVNKHFPISGYVEPFVSKYKNGNKTD